MTTPSTSALHTSNIASLPLLARGKVRDNYAVGDDRILMVASDRLSAFDVIMGEPIPGKGELLTQMALFWFAKLGHICPNHLTGEAPESVVTPEEIPQVKNRAMLVQRLQPIMIEAVVRGYLAGSGWKEYQDSQAVCGVPLPAGLTNAAKLPAPIYTPAAKAEMGDHDENITYERTVEMVGEKLAAQIRDTAIRLYQEAAEIALQKGMIIADTKFEFGLTQDGTLVLRQLRIWGKKEQLFAQLLPRLRPARLAKLLLAAHQVDGIVKGLALPGWPAHGWQALHRLAFDMVQAVQSAR